MRHVRLLSFITAGALAVSVNVSAQTATASKTRAHVTALASDQSAGRLTGSDGEKRASDYIVA